MWTPFEDRRSSDRPKWMAEGPRLSSWRLKPVSGFPDELAFPVGEVSGCLESARWGLQQSTVQWNACRFGRYSGFALLF